MKDTRQTPIEISKAEFQKLGYALVDSIAELLDGMPERALTTGESPQQLQQILGDDSLPETGKSTQEIMSRATELLINHSLYNGHPKFMGYITSSPAPIGMLGDFLAAAVNPNVGTQTLSPISTEIEKQTIRWLAEFIGISPDYGGILVSGGNMANFTAFLAARTAKAPKSAKEDGLTDIKKLIVYCSKTTHTWIEKAAVLFGLGTNQIRWIYADSANKVDIPSLEQAIKTDLAEGFQPFMVVGTAGDVSTGAVDDLKAIGDICKLYDLWFHIDGAYGIPAAIVPELKNMFAGVEAADSIAMDPHKWLYSPLEAGCTLVKNPKHLTDTYSSHPDYYHFTNYEEVQTQNFYEYGFQNSRGFRALKVWLALQQLGRNGYTEMIKDDIALAKLLYDLADQHPELEAITHNLSIATLRYVPADKADDEDYLNQLNETLVDALQQGGEAFLSNAVVDGKYCLRACIVNFRTSKKDIEETIDIIVGLGGQIHQEQPHLNHDN